MTGRGGRTDYPTVRSGPDAGAVWHYGDPSREQRDLEAAHSAGTVDLSHREVLAVSGPDRLEWLHSLTTQHLSGLEPGTGTTAMILSPHGHIEHVLFAVDDGETFWAHTEPGRVAALVAWLDSMRFMMRVEVTDRTADLGIVWAADAARAFDGVRRVATDSLGGAELFVPRDRVGEVLGEHRAGIWAYEARRIAAGVPRIFVDTDHRTIPNEIGMPDGTGHLGPAVHLDKGCYRGQETVARVHNLGRPPRRLTLLHLDGTVDALPELGDDLKLADRSVGRVGSSARHHELGPIALGLVKRNTPVDATLTVGEIAAGQQTLVDPEIGLHVRPNLR